MLIVILIEIVNLVEELDLLYLTTAHSAYQEHHFHRVKYLIF
jgi:hypothetical protein